MYPYYAGFSQAFVEAVFEDSKMGPSSLVMDPWNGSGTTTYAASARGVNSIGYDINPALVIVARARSARISVHATVQRAWERSLVQLRLSDGDAVEVAANVFEAFAAQNPNLGSVERAVLLSAMFETLRQNFAHARSKNPSWYKSKAGVGEHIDPATFVTAVTASLERALRSKVAANHRPSAAPRLHATNFLAARPAGASVDLVLTSPPYLTRIDYVKATLPELLLLQRLGGPDPSALRKLMTGSPLVGSVDRPARDAWGATATNLLIRISRHPSKASNTYYRRFFANYFEQLSLSVGKIERALRDGGRACVVVQTSYYKEVFADLPMIVSEMGAAVGLKTEHVAAFDTNRTMVNVNSRAMSPTDTRTESAVFMRKPT